MATLLVKIEACLSAKPLGSVQNLLEACLNSRPLTALSADPNDLRALTPAHLSVHSCYLTEPFRLSLNVFIGNDYTLISKPKNQEKTLRMEIGDSMIYVLLLVDNSAYLKKIAKESVCYRANNKCKQYCISLHSTVGWAEGEVHYS